MTKPRVAAQKENDTHKKRIANRAATMPASQPNPSSALAAQNIELASTVLVKVKAARAKRESIGPDRTECKLVAAGRPASVVRSVPNIRAGLASSHFTDRGSNASCCRCMGRGCGGGTTGVKSSGAAPNSSDGGSCRSACG
jgi:hypothetical protein